MLLTASTTWCSTAATSTPPSTGTCECLACGAKFSGTTGQRWSSAAKKINVRPIGAVTELGLAVRNWVDGDDPYRLVADALGGAPAATAVTDAMPALHLLPLAEVLGVVPVLATDVLRRLRMIKDAAEVDALRKAGAAIDRVRARVPEFLVPTAS